MLRDITDVTKNLTVNSEIFPFHAVAYSASSTLSICLSKKFNDSLKKAIKKALTSDRKKTLLSILSSEFDDMDIELSLFDITESKLFKEGLGETHHLTALGANALYYNILLGNTVYKIHAYEVVTEAMIEGIKKHVPELYFALEKQDGFDPHELCVLDLAVLVTELPHTTDYFSIDVKEEFGPYIFKEQAEAALAQIGDAPFFLADMDGSFDDYSESALAVFCAKQKTDNAVVLLNNHLKPTVTNDPALVLAHHTHLKEKNSAEGEKANG